MKISVEMKNGTWHDLDANIPFEDVATHVFDELLKLGESTINVKQVITDPH